MNKSFAIILTTIIGTTILWIALFGFEPTLIFLGETKQVNARVIEVKPSHLGRGYYRLNVFYEYQIDSSVYQSSFQAGQGWGVIDTNDRLSIEYSVNSPSKSNVLGVIREK